MALQFNTNLSPATGYVAMYNLIAWLIAQGWTVNASSDGSTYDSTGQQFTSGASGPGGLGNSLAWFVVQMPGSTRQMCVQVSTSQTARMKYSPVDGFISGTPGATQTPAAADEVIFLGSGTDASPTFATVFGGADGSYWQEVAADDAAPCSFYSVCYPTGSTTADNCNSAIFLDPVVNTYPDSDPYAFSAAGGAHSLGSQLNGVQKVYGAVASVYGILGVLAWPANVNAGWEVSPVSGAGITLPVVYFAAGVYPKGTSSLFEWNTLGGVVTPTLGTQVTANDSVQLGTLLLPWNGGEIEV